MATAEEIIDSFQFLGLNVGEQVVKKCVELCSFYSLSAEDFVNEWCAYAASNSDGETPCLDSLILMEKKELGKYNKNVRNKLNASNIANLEISEYTNNSSATATSQSSKSTTSAHNDNEDVNSTLDQNLANSSPHKIICSPQTNVPLVKYANRTNSVAIIYSFGKKRSLPKETDLPKESFCIRVSLWGEEDNWDLCNVSYMYEVLKFKASVLNTTIELLGERIADKSKLKLSHLKSTGACITYGRICCDSDGKLNSASVVLQSSYKIAHGDTISLNLSKLKNYSIFPGQVVVIEGNYLKNAFVVQTLYANAPLEFPKLSFPSDVLGSLQIAVAAGPFTFFNDLTYEPLKDLLEYIQTYKPHVMILIGPFIDICSEQILIGNISTTYDDVFHGLIENIMTAVKDLNTRVILVPSAKDIHHHIVYPTPPYKIRNQYNQLYCASDPCMLNLNGIIIGITSADILSHLAKEELNYGNHNTDRMKQIASYLLNQQSFYPLYPPDPEMYIDHELLEKYGTIQVLPQILILPSNLHFFIKEIDGCIVINPGRLTKACAGGTFCEIQVDHITTGSLINNVTCEILCV